MVPSEYTKIYSQNIETGLDYGFDQVLVHVDKLSTPQ